MLNFSNVSLRRGIRLLFEKANVTIHKGNKVGIVGANGCGKSSLFALLLNKLQTDEGEVSLPPDITIAHVAQEMPAVDRSAIEYVIDGDAELRSIQNQLQQAEAENNGSLQADLHHRLDHIDAYTVKARAGKLMQGLGFKNEQLELPVNSFSGGWRMRLNLAQALICRSDLLLLDEPTNHLDLDAVIWLETWFQSYQGTLLLISHDRDFLDKVVGHIIFIEHQTLELYTGNYNQFEKLRAEQLAQQQSLYEKQQREIAHIEGFVRRFKAKASKAKQAQSRVKTLERMELISQAHVDSPFYFHFFKPDKLPHPLMQLEQIDAGYENNKILEFVNLSISPGDRIGVLGHNGAGKSTLIKVLAGEVALQSGNIEASSEVNIGYFAQHQLEQLDKHASPMLHMQRINKRLTEQEIRNYLGGYNFHGDRVKEPVGPFSGGEKARLVLALIIFQKPNLLLLDEPTNHLDLEMRHALSLALQDYEGAMLVVSHDRHLLRVVTDQFLLVDNGTVALFNGDLDDYRQWLLRPKDNQENNNIQPDSEENNLSKKEQRRLQAEKRRQLQPLQQELKKLEKKIEELSSKKGEIEAILAGCEIYEGENKEKLQALIKEQSQVLDKLVELEEQWLVMSEQMESE
ncbi:MAG: ATP-binding cassette domain-containing protein [Gammaproteobacteria bacterium]|nr:ATP-binding cassette domain-containing protein [Gammaproteobacteria bacterium]MCW8910983.1 ATP-binding cassette domain-containing protein [Gammaproteobacteria bacterium]MCW9005002.1 ATP-binding cassette domain-containing protein [Gammaproteobacteria bacterium]MCW9055590.1 ATP-binding cassette domain-containing protein [Gammaproteobacteria bacterium]